MNKLYFIAFHVIIFLSISICNYAQCDRSRDSLALVALYQSTDGQREWDNKWNIYQSMDNWYGVQLSPEGCVICLDLDGNPDCQASSDGGNHVIGLLPEEIGSLSELEVLILNDNQFNGVIPSELGNLFNLRQLELGENNFYGSLPVDLSNLANLDTLNLKSNHFDGCIPDTYSELCGTFVDLSGNGGLAFDGNFSVFCSGELQIGQSCDDNNEMTEGDAISSDCECVGSEIIFASPRLRDSMALLAIYNKLDGENWTNKWNLNSPFDTWYGLDVNAGGDLTCIDLDGTVNCSSVGSLGNNLKGILPIELGFCSNLETLCLRQDSIKGVIPASFGKLRRLKTLSISSTEIYGGVPEELGNLVNLEYLNLVINGLNGGIPSSIGQLDKVRILIMNNNNLSGEIPEEFSLMKGLEVVSLADNELVGEIPQDLSNFPTLYNMNFSKNNLTGEIPISIGEMEALAGLDLSKNRLSGEIPKELFLTPVFGVDLSYNMLEGDIPAEIGNGLNLERINASNNLLSGKIPEEIGDNNKFASLIFSDNLLSGSIPGSIGALPNLSEIFLQNNMLDGCFDSLLMPLCALDFQPFENYFGYNFTNNPKLPWEGDFLRFCEGQDQIGAECNDGDPATEMDVIQEDCSCEGIGPSKVEETPSNKIRFFPNPTSETLNIDFEEGSNFEVSLYSLENKLVFRETNPTQINMLDFVDGLYFVKYTNQETGKVGLEKVILSK